ncbi:10517_t:CDS:10 [Ambispora gerdemannii]|uniref:histidine kinase n=1 Tax=Ambispora gerdemannii TaxID=144530 RepID=A0A9N8UZJ5_9GLOM|nr:10517_t:CDS:10 [Ambispora gerdemannii]
MKPTQFVLHIPPTTSHTTITTSYSNHHHHQEFSHNYNHTSQQQQQTQAPGQEHHSNHQQPFVESSQQPSSDTPTKILPKPQQEHSNSEQVYQKQLQRQQQQQLVSKDQQQKEPQSKASSESHISQKTDYQNLVQPQPESQQPQQLPSQQVPPQQSQNFPSPNLYRISLQLTTELDIRKWWDNVIETFTTSFHASRILLSVPHDLTDTINTPWGVKAIYNRDSHSNGGGNAGHSDNITDSASNSSNDHGHLVFDKLRSFECDIEPLLDNKGILRILHRGKIIVVSREYRQPEEENKLWNSTISPQKQQEEEMGAAFPISRGPSGDRGGGGGGGGGDGVGGGGVGSGNGRVENGVSPLKNNNNMGETTKLITLTPTANTTTNATTINSNDIQYNLSNYNNHHHHHRHSHNKHRRNKSDGSITSIISSSISSSWPREFEQQQPSPWSQSPAPSPVVTDPNINPFFQSMPVIDDEAFNPSSASPLTHASSNFTFPVGTNNNVYSIVHIPLIHPTTAKNVAPTNALHSPVPIAILSFLSCVVPYPSNLLRSLHALSPYLATTFSMATIHQQTVKDLSLRISYPRAGRRQQRHSNNSHTHQTHSLDRIEYVDSVSSDEYSTTSSSSSRWEYATVFSTRFGQSPGTDKEDPFSRNSVSDDENYDDDVQIVNENDFMNSTEESSLITDNSSKATQTVASSSSLNRERKPRRVSLARYHSSHRRNRKSRRSSKTNSVNNQFGSSSHNTVPQLVVPNTKLLRLILDVMPNAVYTCSRISGDCTWVNNRMIQYCGNRIEDMLGYGLFDTIHPDDKSRVWEMWTTAFSRGEGFSAQYRIRRFDGHYRWFLGRAGPLRDARGIVIHWFGTCTDVHDQKQAEEQQARQLHVEANEKKYRQLAEAIPQIVFTATPKDGITYVNEKWTTYSGLTFEQSQGLGFLSHVHSDDRSKCILPDAESDDDSHGEVRHQEEVRLMSSDGTYKWFLVKCISIESSEQGRKWFGTCTDINDHKLLEHKLKEAHDAAQKSTESKTRFLSNMSHEIRTPLIGITGMINFMLDTHLTVEQLDYAHTIQQSADALLLVINDILDLSKVEAGMMKLEMEPFSVHTMIEDANELLSTLAIQKGLELSFIVDDDVPDVICGDRIRLRQVLLNVIGNAIKFTSDGEVFSRCSVQQLDSDNRVVDLLFEVVDTGPGFDAEEELVMFKPFSQVDTSSTRKYGGSGLGLVISRQLIELHGGKMYCKSRKGEGSVFYFSARFNVPNDSTSPRPQTPTSEVSNSPFFRYSKASVESSAYANKGVHNGSVHNEPSSSNSTASMFSSYSFPISPHDLGSNSSGNGRSTSPYPITPKPSVSASENDGSTIPMSPPNSSRPITPTSGSGSRPATPIKPRKPIYIDLPRPACVLIIAELPHARKTLEHYVRSILPKTPVPEIDISFDYTDAIEILSQSDVKQYTHVFINLYSQPDIISLAAIIKNLPSLTQTVAVILTTPIQRAGVMEGAQNDLPSRVDFIFKPLNRSKMEGLFDDTTTVRENFLKRRNTHQIVASQKEIFKRMAEDVGGRGLRVLLVEDNFVNQKVIIRYLTKVGLEVTVANNGVQCLETFYSHPPDYFSLILCDLFMPVKDGYQTTKEIRAWEADNLSPNQRPIPIIAMSANVFSDVASKCDTAGFNTYVSKPVNFATLSDAIRSALVVNDTSIQDNTKSSSSSVPAKSDTKI